MAQYGYSTPYSGQQVAPLPPGYMEAATASGRNLAMGITAIGQGLGKALERYTENKKAHEAADQTNTAVTQMFLQQMENDPKVQAVRYFEDTGQLPTGVDETTLKSYEAQMKRDAGMISNLVGSSAKWADMSLTKKKTALGDTVTMLNQYRNNQQDDFKNQATRQQLAVGALQLEKAKFDLEDIKAKREQQNILSGAVQYGLDQPTTTTQTERVTDTINFPPIPGRVTPAVMATPSQAEATAARYYMGQYGQAAKDLQQYGEGLGAQANALNVSQIPKFTGPISLGQEDPEAYLNQQFESPIVAAARAEANIRLRQQQLGESQAAMQQAGIMSRSPALQTIGQRTLQTAQEAPPIQQPPETRTRNVSTQVPISYEDQSKRLTQYLVQQGAKPETLAMVPQILSMVGQQRPMQIESKTLPSGITVVRADGKIDILAAPKPIEGKPLNESQGKAASFAAGMKLNNDTINSVFKSGYSPKSLTELGFMPERLKTDSRKSYETSRDAWIENFLRDRSGAVISPEEYPATEKQYFPMAGDSEKIVKQKEAMRIDAMNNTMKKAGQHADDYVNQISNQSKSGVLKYNTATKRFE